MSGDGKAIHIGYIVLSHGPRHTNRTLLDRPGAPSQARSITSLTGRFDHFEILWHADYVRTPRGPEDFRVLFHILEQLGGTTGGLVFIDGAERLFGKLPRDRRAPMLAALEPYHGAIFDVRRARILRDFKDWEWRAVSSAGLFKPTPAASTVRVEESAGSQATRRARHVSRLARARLADRAARPIAELQEELSRAGATPTYAALAKEANARGLRTSRGSEWSDVAIARALRRLADPAE